MLMKWPVVIIFKNHGKDWSPDPYGSFVDVEQNSDFSEFWTWKTTIPRDMGCKNSPLVKFQSQYICTYMLGMKIQ